MPQDTNKFYLEQIKARLAYYRELGIEGFARRATPYGVDNSEAKGTESQGQTARPKASTNETAPPYTPSGTRNLSLFEDPFKHSGSVETLKDIRQDLGDCRRCKLCSARTHIVFGSGSPEAKLVFIGEGPGADEDAQGLPFVGRAGQLLTKIIESINLRREDVYICNVIKCRPPNNRFPEKDEVAACSPFLFRQLEAIKPQVICCLGAAAAQTILNSKSSIGWLRGRIHDYRGAILIATYHPAYLLRNPEAKRDVWEDMKKVKSFLET